MNTYTEEEIKKAFWSMFHKEGEIFFNYLDTEEENERCTNNFWLEFIDTLNGDGWPIENTIVDKILLLLTALIILSPLLLLYLLDFKYNFL